MERDDHWMFDTAGPLIIFFKLGSAHKHKDTKIYKSLKEFLSKSELSQSWVIL